MKNKFSHLKFSIFTQHPYTLKYYFKHPIKFVSHYWYDIKRAYERATKGYSYWDLCDIDSWFLDLMPRMIKDFKSSYVGFPVNMTDDEWDKILEEMFIKFKESKRETCSLINTYEKDYDKWIGIAPKNDTDKALRNHIISDYFASERMIDKICDDNLRQALDLFYKYFHNLWI